MPMPVSAIISTMESSSTRLRTTTVPPSGVNFTALDSRLTMICLTARRSATTEMASSISASSVRFLSSARAGDDAQRFRQRLRQVELLHVELHAAGLDLRHVEDVVDDFQQIMAAGQNVVAVFLVFLRAERAEHAAAHDLGEPDDGIERRAQLVAHIGEEFGFGLVGFLGAVLLLGIFFGEVGEFDGLALELGLRTFQIDDGGAQAKVVVDQLLLVLLDAGDVGADRNIAAILGAALADVQPVAVIELRLEGARARRLAWRSRAAGCGLPACGRLRSRSHRRCRASTARIRQLVQALEVRVAEHQAVFRVPQHERFRDGLDRVAQPQIGFDSSLGEALLLGDVDGDADQMQAGIGRALAESRSGPAARSSGRWRAASGNSGRCGRSSPEMSWSAMANRSMSSDFTSALTSPKVSRSLRVSSPSIVNIDCDQNIRPRDRSQSHNPQRPRLSAVSIRPRTASLMRSPSRARVDCQ